jgi:predicted DCC family thiol-disulfide oxidoreductase YuxK
MDLAKPTAIIFFDGPCALCNACVDFLVKADRKRLFRYASLQGQTAQRLLEADQWSDKNTIVFKQDNKISIKTEAIARILKELPFPFFALGIFLSLFPHFLANKLYDFVAKNRYQWFGKFEGCRVPNARDKSQAINHHELFLD